jgi:hypothetical protein
MDVLKISVEFNSQVGVAVIRQCRQIVVVPPSDIQAVITWLMQAYADSVDAAEALNGKD